MQKARFAGIVKRLRAGDSYSTREYIWAEVRARRNGPHYLAELEKAQSVNLTAYTSRKAAQEADARAELAANVAEWEKLQAGRVQEKAEGRKLPERDKARWVQLSHILGGKYLVPFASENPGASYIPGQWSSAIHADGNGLTESIKKSGENWLEQRQKQYNADWPRSQRAY